MNASQKPKYQPILRLNAGIHGLLMTPEGMPYQSSSYHETLERRITLYRQGLLNGLSDIENIKSAGIDELFIKISEARIDACRDVIAMFQQKCSAIGISLNLIIPATEKAEMLDLHPFLRHITQNGAKLCFGEFGLFGNNFMQIVTTLPGYVFLDKHVLRWCEESKFHLGFSGIIKLLENMQCKVIVCGAENTRQLQMIFNANVELVLSHHLFGAGTLDAILQDSVFTKSKSISESI